MKSANTYIDHLSKDKKLKKVIVQHKPFVLKQKRNVCIRLCASIMSQQLSVKVSAVIFKRFLLLYSQKEPTPEQIVETPFETLRGIGLSNAKTRYVQNVAQFAIENGMEYKKLNKMTNEEIIVYLTSIKGVGRWTVEMLLMFTLGRPDVFAPDDLGIQNAMIRLYKLDRSDKKKFREEMLHISSKWSPFCTYACLHLWHYKDAG